MYTVVVDARGQFKRLVETRTGAPVAYTLQRCATQPLALAAASAVSSEESPRRALNEVCPWCQQSTGDRAVADLAGKCAACQSVVYCSELCQRGDWAARHQFTCRGH